MGLHTDAMEGLAQLNKYRLECHKGITNLVLLT
jgi:hypothetical protein